MRYFSAGLVLAVLLTLGGCGGEAAKEPTERIDPYRNYFVALGPQGVFLLPTLRHKQAFDRLPALEADAGQPPASLPPDPNEPIRPTTQPWAVFVDRTGRRIFIAGDEELVERIRVAYEDRERAVLLPVTSTEAPPVDESVTEPDSEETGD